MDFLMRTNSGTGRGKAARLASFREESLRGGSGSAISAVDSNSTMHYLREETRAARSFVTQLDTAVSGSSSYKEAALQLSEEAFRALSRLEQAVAMQETPELIPVACEVKVLARRGLSLVTKYGRMTLLGRVASMTSRSAVEAKFAEVIGCLQGLMPSGVASLALTGTDIDSGGGGASTSTVSGPASRLSSSGRPLSPASRLERRLVNLATITPPTPGAPLAHGQVVRAGRRDRVRALAFAPPGADGASSAGGGGGSIWWCVPGALEFYADATQCTTSFPAFDARSVATCVGVDSHGNVWVGSVKGAVRVRNRRSWDQVVEERVLSGCVRCVAFDADEPGIAWVGDDEGHVRVVALDLPTGQLQVVGSLLVGEGCWPPRRLGDGAADPSRSASRASLPKGARSATGGGGAGGVGAAAAAAAAAAGGGAPAAPRAWRRRGGGAGCGCMRVQAAGLEGPVRVAHVADGRAWLAGGRSEPWLALYDSATYAHLDLVGLGQYGACRAMSALPWLLGGGSGSLGTPSATPTARTARGASSIDLGREAAVVAAAATMAVPLVSMGRAAWLLLTGHDGGAVLVWQASSDVLAPLSRIGDMTHGVRGIMLLEPYSLLVTAHTNGQLAIYICPSAEDLDLGLSPPSASALNGDGSLSGAGAPFALSVLRPRRALVEAHRSHLALASALGPVAATASTEGVIRLWQAFDLAREADRQGLLVPGLHQLTGSITGSEGSYQTAPAASRGGGGGGGGSFSRDALWHRSSSSAAEGLPAAAAGAAAARRHSSDVTLMQQHSIETPPSSHGTGPLDRVASRTASGPLDSSSGGGAGAGAARPPASPQRPPASPPRRPPPGPTPTMAAVAAAAAAEAAASLHAGDGCLESAPLPPAQDLGWALDPGQHHHVLSGPVLGLGPIPEITAPRAPRSQRAAAGPVVPHQPHQPRERRKSERRLSRGGQLFQHCQVIDAQQELKLLSMIGAGAYGKVWLADWRGTQVAVKELVSFQEHARVHARHKNKVRRRQGFDDDDGSSSDSDASLNEEVEVELRTLMDEVYLLGTLTHPNIMRFCAVCLDPPMIVSQYYAHGSLFDLLRKARSGERRAISELSWPKRLDMLRDVAAGMVFLHSRKPPIIHGDLRSPNLLLDLSFDRDRPRFHVKIADFGLARVLEGNRQTLSVAKTTNPRWSAPEVISQSVVSRSADVFSFAVVMWEILTWQQPYEEMMSVQVLVSVTAGAARPALPDDDSELPGRPGPSLGAYKTLMEECWADEAAVRPSFEDVVARLDEMRAADTAARRSSMSASRGPASSDMESSYPGTPRSGCNSNTSGLSGASDEATVAALAGAARGASNAASGTPPNGPQPPGPFYGLSHAGVGLTPSASGAYSHPGSSYSGGTSMGLGTDGGSRHSSGGGGGGGTPVSAPGGGGGGGGDGGAAFAPPRAAYSEDPGATAAAGERAAAAAAAAAAAPGGVHSDPGASPGAAGGAASFPGAGLPRLNIASVGSQPVLPAVRTSSAGLGHASGAGASASPASQHKQVLFSLMPPTLARSGGSGTPTLPHHAPLAPRAWSPPGSPSSIANTLERADPSFSGTPGTPTPAAWVAGGGSGAPFAGGGGSGSNWGQGSPGSSRASGSVGAGSGGMFSPSRLGPGGRQRGAAARGALAGDGGWGSGGYAGGERLAGGSPAAAASPVAGGQAAGAQQRLPSPFLSYQRAGGSPGNSGPLFVVGADAAAAPAAASALPNGSPPPPAPPSARSTSPFAAAQPSPAASRPVSPFAAAQPSATPVASMQPSASGASRAPSPFANAQPAPPSAPSPTAAPAPSPRQALLSSPFGNTASGGGGGGGATTAAPFSSPFAAAATAAAADRAGDAPAASPPMSRGVSSSSRAVSPFSMYASATESFMSGSFMSVGGGTDPGSAGGSRGGSGSSSRRISDIGASPRESGGSGGGAGGWADGGGGGGAATTTTTTPALGPPGWWGSAVDGSAARAGNGGGAAAPPAAKPGSGGSGQLRRPLPSLSDSDGGDALPLSQRPYLAASSFVIKPAEGGARTASLPASDSITFDTGGSASDDAAR